MNIKYYDDKVIERNRNSIFLAGPTPRDGEVKSWRRYAIKILELLGFDGDVFVPEYKNRVVDSKNIVYDEIINWELEHLDRASVVMFWIPRELKNMPAFTTNVEFGYNFHTNKIVYGRPDDAPKNRYLDFLYKKYYNLEPATSLVNTVKGCLKKLSSKEQKTFFVSDTHFGAQRTLELSKRPYKNTEEMDNDFVRKWNAKIAPNSTVYHLGDFGNFDVLNKLNGKITLILGNYEKKEMKEKYNDNFDEYKKMLLNKGFENVVKDGLFIKLKDDSEVYLTHEPIDCKRDCFNLFGHIHQLCTCKRFGLNVGIDCLHYEPFSMDDVLFYKNAIEKHYDINVFSAENDLTK